MSEAAEKKETGDVSSVRIVTPKARSAEVELDWPVEVDGILYDKITVRRVTGREVEKFIRDTMEAKDGERPQPPLIDCPLAVYEALDDDDRLKLEEAMLPFLPRRLLMLAESTRESVETSSEE